MYCNRDFTGFGESMQLPWPRHINHYYYLLIIDNFYFLLFINYYYCLLFGLRVQ